MTRLLVTALLASACLTHSVSAHPQPATLVSFDIATHQVTAELHDPLSELELAFGHAVTKQPLNRW